MTIERIIMITGSKGGGGKTPVATSIALSLHKLGIPLIACDFNFNNADMFAILHGTNVDARREKNYLQSEYNGINEYFRLDDAFWLTRWKSTLEIGLPSIESFWDKILEIAETDFSSAEQPKVLVLDTNLTLPLIAPPLPAIQNYPTLPPVEVVHLWSPSIVLQLEEQERFEKAIDVLNRFSPGFEDRMTHIFTPRHHNSSGFFGTFSTITKGEFKVGKKLKYKQASPKPITFSEMKETLFADFLPQILNLRSDMEVDIEELMTNWLNNIISQLEHREYRTHNVVLIPTVVHNIALLVEKLTLKPRRTFETVRNDMGTLYYIILSHYDEFLELKELEKFREMVK